MAFGATLLNKVNIKSKRAKGFVDYFFNINSFAGLFSALKFKALISMRLSNVKINKVCWVGLEFGKMIRFYHQKSAA